MARVRLGYFEDFKMNHTLLLEADAAGLRALVATFRALASGRVAGVALHHLPFVEVHHGVQLTAVRGSRNRGARRASIRNVFGWERTKDGWHDLAEKLDLLVGQKDGHYYVEEPEDDVVIQVSKGEYGDDWWRRHG